jgi:hypothetical protein
MPSGAFSLRNAMASVGIRHELELLVVLDQFILQHFCILVMHIVIACAVDVQKISPQVFCMGYG